MLYRSVLFSDKPQHESAIGIHVSYPLPLKLLPISLSFLPLYIDTEALFEFAEPYSKFPWAIYFIYCNVSFHVTLSIHLTLFSPLSISISLFSMSVSPLLPRKFFSNIFIDSVYMHSVQFSHSVMSDSLRLYEPQHTRPPCPSPVHRVHSNPCPLSW